MQFGVSTHLYHASRLQREHLAGIAGAGFEAVELFATRSHFDYADEASIAALAGWLAETGLTLHGIHGPVTDTFGPAGAGRLFTIASADPEARALALSETARALDIARVVPTRFFVLHLGDPGDPRRWDASIRGHVLAGLERIHAVAEPLGVRLALEVLPHPLATPSALADLLEDDLDLPGVGICLDIGHAFLLGDVAEAIETVGEHLITTHVHDNDGRADRHLVPFEGRIDWAAALMELQKVGYEAPLLLEVGATADPPAVLRQARAARGRIEALLAFDGVRE